MDQIGYIRNVYDDMAEVEVRRISGCGGSCSSCGGACNVPSITVQMENLIGAKPGDYVEIRGKSNKIIKYALIVYMIPFFMLILGIITGISIFKSFSIDNFEIYSLLIGMAFLSISFLIVRKIDNFIRDRNDKAMEMVRILKVNK
ncbi:RseC/MucC-like positive regulator of sigma(E) [Keratinibaculum paraultunense]|uniref:RseC/MucC-like positive regulator of sigma(E) n=1 Tax=Keratinibaculum paraultunense TaxID=1278232 RepID=A0A4R3KVB9_9FIRM|nr:SoxR reducing system RseC family protein [Keratinibaculum paraultunense]QQY78749.1 SoxR reducing system RseC family protein [Keratinibaculum paraultunense]TCS89571.1 RseC/MucC-like positive regulator of sigma(E) [Keratinibaculum paraultunense]